MLLAIINRIVGRANSIERNSDPDLLPHGTSSVSLDQISNYI